MKIISGKTGSPHVTSQQFRQIFEGIIGDESCILPCGENLTPELQTNNSLKIRSGLMYHHGNLSTVELGTYDEVTIQNGTQGMKRIDLVVNRYTREEESGTEKNEWIVIQGTPHASSPTVPDYTEGNLQDGDLVDDCPYLEVHLDGINVTEVKQLLSVANAMSTTNKDLNGSGYSGTVSLNHKFVKPFASLISSTVGNADRNWFWIVNKTISNTAISQVTLGYFASYPKTQFYVDYIAVGVYS